MAWITKRQTEYSVSDTRQDRAVRKAQSIVDRLFRQRVGVADGTALSQHCRLVDLLPVRVVFHLGGVFPVVVEHGAVGIHQGDAAAAGQIFLQIDDPLIFNSMSDVSGADGQIRQDTILKIAVEHAHNQQRTGQQNCQ